MPSYSAHRPDRRSRQSRALMALAAALLLAAPAPTVAEGAARGPIATVALAPSALAAHRGHHARKKRPAATAHAAVILLRR